MRGVVSHNMITIILCYVAVRDGVTALAVAVAVELAVEEAVADALAADKDQTAD